MFWSIGRLRPNSTLRRHTKHPVQDESPLEGRALRQGVTVNVKVEA
jgi:hypothetical protein